MSGNQAGFVASCLECLNGIRARKEVGGKGRGEEEGKQQCGTILFGWVIQLSNGCIDSWVLGAKKKEGKGVGGSLGRLVAWLLECAKRVILGRSELPAAQVVKLAHLSLTQIPRTSFSQPNSHRKIHLCCKRTTL